mmetsp:Transcript_36707/g.63042  ORF Transcript_36707/g.63042 Transcript_36707/m.63042 type:complete len:83 (-) Transcript_36707:58-306(-)
MIFLCHPWSTRPPARPSADRVSRVGIAAATGRVLAAAIRWAPAARGPRSGAPGEALKAEARVEAPGTAGGDGCVLRRGRRCG